MKIFSFILFPSKLKIFLHIHILLYFLLYRNTARRPVIPKTASKPGIPGLCFWDGLWLSFCPGVCPVFPAVLPVLVLFWVFTVDCVLSAEGCIVPVPVVFPVIAKGENPGVWAVKYR
jgi:hypothetical protein